MHADQEFNVHDPLNAFCRHTHVSLPPTAEGSLNALRFALKDIYDVVGHRTGFGSPDWLRTHPPAARSAPVLEALLAAGARLIGKSHTEEMAFSLTGENAHYGTPINPAAPGRVPGGSSSGSAAAVAGELVDFAIGSDTGGSVRAPASFCGIFGIRPTHGRISMDGACALAPSFDTCGWFARDAEILERVGHILLGARAVAPVGGLLYATDAFAHAEPDVVTALEPMIERVVARVGRAERVVLAEEGLAHWFSVFRTLQYDEIGRTHGDWIREAQPQFGERVAPRFAAVLSADAEAVPAALEGRARIAARLDELLAGNRVLLMPTMPDIAPPLNEATDTGVTVRERALAMLCTAGLGGLPQLSIPAARVRGCPVGLSILAARGNDELLLALARDLC